MPAPPRRYIISKLRPFQTLFGTLLGELMDGSALTGRLGRLDASGIDAYVVTSNGEVVRNVIPCKGFELPRYGEDQRRQCRREIAKYEIQD